MVSKDLVKLGGAVLLVAAAACGGAVSDEGETQDGLSTSRKSYVSVRRDMRRCAAPACGGYFVRDVNRKNAIEFYVGSLDFSASNLDESAIDAVRSADASELLLQAKLTTPDATTHVRNLKVYAAWRGMPGVKVAAGDTFYVAETTGVQCFAAPCMNVVATKLNDSSKTGFSSFDMGSASKSHVDQEWLTSRVRDHGAIASARLVDGVRMAAGNDKVLAASQVFVKLPEMFGPCRASPVKQCGEGEVAAFDRDENRCVNFTGCVKAGVCAQVVPSCDAGYTAVQWKGGSAGCPVWACDPTFSLPASAQ